MTAMQLSLTGLPPIPDQASVPEQASRAEAVPDINDPLDDSVAASSVVDVTDSDDRNDVAENDPAFLCGRDRRILALERQWFANPGSKEATITRQFGITPTRYFQILNGLLDDPRAMRESPQVVARLRRLRTARQRSRRRYRRVLGHRR